MQQLHTPQQAAAWLRDRVTGKLHIDSRQIGPGDGFVAWPGAATDGRAFVAHALAQGARACLVEHDGVEAFALPDDGVASYRGLKAAAGLIAAHYHGEPSRELAVVAITGTNGKTSSAWWLAHALSNLEHTIHIPCGLIGTFGIGVAKHGQFELTPTGMTTPDPVRLQHAFRSMVSQGLRACAIEASSIGLEEQRLAGSHIRCAVFTNFTQDHLDYHGSMAAYWQAKAALFQWPGLQSAAINIDDPHGAQLATDLQTSPLEVWTLSCTQPARLQASDIRFEDGGLCFNVTERGPHGTQTLPLATRLIGQYNVANLLGVIAAMRCLGVPLAACIQACHRLQPVPGRMACLGGAGQPLVAVDYAHTPDALSNALQALRPLAAQRGGQLVCVFGCGGDRDPIKRPLMGEMAARHADSVIVTSDNPRSEAPQAIIDQILPGLAGHAALQVQADRALAIALAVTQAQAHDVVLVAGKGHEDYQDIAGVKQPFSDEQQVRQSLQTWAGPAATATAGRMLNLQQALAWLPGAHLVGDGRTECQRVHTDTRSIAPGDLFVALKGERFDANDLLAQAKAQGAVAALCHSREQLVQAGLPGLVVPDTRLALGALATGWRKQFKLPLIAVTGSNGKTTVTQMIAAILRAYQPSSMLATQGNFNNDIGVPLTLLRLRSHHSVAVVELGMNHPGEIAQLAAMARPTVALVNNAQREHLEFMATIEAVAQENGAVISALAGSGVAVFPQDDAYTALWQALAAQRAQLTFSAAPASSSSADVTATSAVWAHGAWQVQAQTPAGALAYTLHIAGAHNVKNSLAAVACALAAGVPLPAIAQGLAAFEPVKGRSRALSGQIEGRAFTLVDDSYNANPDSVRAAIDVLAALPGPRLLVLGDMGEVGAQGPQFHAEAGAHARAQGIESLLALGALTPAAVASFGAGGRHFSDVEGLNAAVLASLPQAASLVVKGSRFMRMERVVEAVMAQVQTQSQPEQSKEEMPCS
jgi:MurE/MurF fusion protein